MSQYQSLGTITMRNNAAIIPALLSYTGEVVKIVGFSDAESRKIELAVEEACLHVINHSFNPDEDATYDVSFFKRLDGIEIQIHDMGLPYDPGIEPVYDPLAGLHDRDLQGLGTYLISKTMDEYRFNNLGIKGKEMVLIKYFNTPLIATENEAPVEPEVVKPPSAGQPVEQIDFDIRLMKPDEALEVCRCIYDCYGYSYANENVYFPDRVAAMNQSGKLLSAVAMTKEGEMGGHFALITYDKLPAEVGIAVTKKKFRGQGFARQLGEHIEAEARQMGLRGLQVKEVTAHPYTQKFCMKLGYKDCGLLLAHSPKSLSFKGIAETLKQRNSDILGFKYLESPVSRKIYAPIHHKKMIGLLFDNIGDVVEFSSTDSLQNATEAGVIEVNVHTLRSLAEMLIIKNGHDTIQTVRHEMRKIFADEIQVIELYVSLNDPTTQSMIPQLESLGFIFTGVLPETAMGDAMVMQYFNGVHIDYDQIVIVSEVAKTMLEYVKDMDPWAKIK